MMPDASAKHIEWWAVVITDSYTFDWILLAKLGLELHRMEYKVEMVEFCVLERLRNGIQLGRYS
jgi:hypothetical protein